MAVRFSRDGRRVFVANYLTNEVQIVDIVERKVVNAISLGGPAELGLARRGEAIFYDGQRSLDQWYSCHSCHYDGGANAVVMDTRNDGSAFSFKTVPSLVDVTKTAPWTWHGWQEDLADAMHKSLEETMLGPEPREEDIVALIAYLDTLRRPPNPYLTAEGGLDPAAERGRAIFEGRKARCADCHRPPLFTDDSVYDVGTGAENDAYDGFNPPSLLGVHRRVRLLHDGMTEDLDTLLRGSHSPEKVSGGEPLSDEEISDLVAYLRSL